MEPIKLQDITFEKYCPLSVKQEKNKPVPSNYPATNKQMFLSDRNVYILAKFIIAMNIKNNTKTPQKILERKIPAIMTKWATETHINDYEDLTDNILETLSFLNQSFLKDHPELYNRADCSGINVFRITGRTTDRCNNQANKKFDNMFAHDYHTVDWWHSQKTFTNDKQKRYNNAIPIWQKSMNTRHYDLSNDGLHDAVPERASLNNQIHGYDMSNIIKGSTYYEQPSYENL